MSLKIKFRRWYKNTGKIMRMQQGDDNLMAVMFKKGKNYEVGVWKYLDQKKTFKMLEIRTDMKLQEARNKFVKTVMEF